MRLGDERYIFWHKEDDGTYSKYAIIYLKNNTMRNVSVYESNVTEKEYFKRKLANEL
jgi:hypothetical protein